MEATHIPIRIQLSRKKGWRMPPNTVSVARPGQYGNPFRIGGYFMMGDPHGKTGPLSMLWCSAAPGHEDDRFTLIETNAQAVEWFKKAVAAFPDCAKYYALRGKNLACWCKLDQPCHADVLLDHAAYPMFQP